MAVQLKHDIRGYHAGNISKRYLREAEAADEFELSSKLAKGGDSVSNIEMRHVPVPEDDNIFLYTGQ